MVIGSFRLRPPLFAKGSPMGDVLCVDLDFNLSYTLMPEVGHTFRCTVRFLPRATSHIYQCRQVRSFPVPS